MMSSAGSEEVRDGEDPSSSFLDKAWGATSAGGKIIKAGGQRIGDRVKATEAPLLRKLMRGANIVNGAGAVASGLVRMATLGKCDGACPLASTFVVGFYSFIFGMLLLAFELRWGERYDEAVRKNCGFLYSMTGLTYFLAFIATLLFSVPMFSSDAPPLWWISLLVGLFTIFNVVLHFFVRCYHPDFKGGGGGDADIANGVDAVGLDAEPHRLELGAMPDMPQQQQMVGEPMIHSDYSATSAPTDTGAAGGPLSVPLPMLDPAVQFHSSSPTDHSSLIDAPADNPFADDSARFTARSYTVTTHTE